MNCPFCEKTDYIKENEFWYCVYDSFPVSKGHCLIITKQHRVNYLDCTHEEKSTLLPLIDSIIDLLQNEFEPNGFNVGMNIGEHSGQSILHTHIHIIPRYKGDVENPRGGVRGVIPSKQNYNG